MNCRWAPFATGTDGLPITWACVSHGVVALHVSETCRDPAPGSSPAFPGATPLAARALTGK